MKGNTAEDEPPVRSYARLLRQLHELIAEGKGDSEEAEALADEMDSPWYAMSEQEIERVGGLSEDLYALAEVDVKPAEMSNPDRDRWDSEFKTATVAGNWDRLFQLLRHPPKDRPVDYIRFMQARCWEYLGDPDTASVFRREAERIHANS